MKGHLHIVIAGYRYDTCFDTWLWDLGTTNADVSHGPGHACTRCIRQWFGQVMCGQGYNAAADGSRGGLRPGVLLQVTLYRRTQPALPERSWAGPCGMSVMERLLVPNHGKDGAVFYVSTLVPHPLWAGPLSATWLPDSNPCSRTVHAQTAPKANAPQ